MCRMYSSVVNFNASLNTQFVRLITFYLCLPTVGPYWLSFGAQTSQSALGKKKMTREVVAVYDYTVMSYYSYTLNRKVSKFGPTPFSRQAESLEPEHCKCPMLPPSVGQLGRMLRLGRVLWCVASTV